MIIWHFLCANPVYNEQCNVMRLKVIILEAKQFQIQTVWIQASHYKSLPKTYKPSTKKARSQAKDANLIVGFPGCHRTSTKTPSMEWYWLSWDEGSCNGFPGGLTLRVGEKGTNQKGQMGTLSRVCLQYMQHVYRNAVQCNARQCDICNVMQCNICMYACTHEVIYIYIYICVWLYTEPSMYII